MTRIFLSAAYPAGNTVRGRRVGPYSLSDIDLAVTAIIENVLEGGCKLRFGGHPTISPLVLDLASLLQRGQQVELYQSLHFENGFTPEVRRLIDVERADLVTTAVDPRDDERASLHRMRTEMFSDPIDAAFFVGGMDGIKAELELLRTAQPTVHIFLMHRPGGMARLLADRYSHEGPGEVETLRGSAYDVLVSDALEELQRNRHS